MSRNLGRTDCYFCGGNVKFIEKPRVVEQKDCGAYYPEYIGMVVANSECANCKAKYLAWVETPFRWHGAENERGFCDMSFRSTFNDEPGPDDMPMFYVEHVRVRKPWPLCMECGLPMSSQYDGSRCIEEYKHAEKAR